MSGTCAARVDYPRRGVQALLGDEEFFLPFDCFPWFKSATIEQLT